MIEKTEATEPTPRQPIARAISISMSEKTEATKPTPRQPSALEIEPNQSMQGLRESYKENYALLKSVAEDLRKAQEVDVDELLPKVEMASKAHSYCKTRIDQAQQVLDKIFGKEQAD